MTDLNTFSPFSYQLLILLTVILSKAVVSHFIQYEPLRYFQFYCLKLSDKVNKQQNSPQQQTIAGLVAIMVTLVPIAVILWLFEAFIAVDFLWQALLLYMAIGSFGLAQINKTIAQALVAKQNYLAKQTLKPWVLRETEQLSSLGLSKACIEMLLLRTLQQGYTVALIFIFFGSLPAGKNFILFWRLSKHYFFQLNNNIALLLLALNLEVKLGGVAMYHNNEKLRKISFNDLARQPQVTDIIHASKKISQIIYISLFFIILLSVTGAFIAAHI